MAAPTYRIEMYSRAARKWQPYPDASQPLDTLAGASTTLLVYREGLSPRVQLRMAMYPPRPADPTRPARTERWHAVETILQEADRDRLRDYDPADDI